jgi:hypothetical protein
MKRKTMAFRLTLLTFALGLASTASAQLVITQLGTPTVITFDTATPGIYHPRTGTGDSRSISEPNSWDIDPNNNSANKPSALISTGVALSQTFHTGYTGQGNGSPTRFAADGNGNGNINDNDIGFETMLVLRPDQGTGLASNALRLSNNNDYALNSFYFRIQNNTGSTVSAWNFKADLFIAEPDDDGFSNIQFAYAVDNGNNPAAMTFTTFGGPFEIKSGMTLVGTHPQFKLDYTVNLNPGVANGGYIVLAFLDNPPNNTAGSTVFIDNIGITAVPEPSTYALIGLGLAALFTLRRLSAKSS